MKIDKQNLGWIIAGILILVMISYAGLSFLNSQADKKIKEGVLIGQEQIVLKINQEGIVPVISQEEEELYIKWVSIQEVCGDVS